jgi:hypothetical protein
MVLAPFESWTIEGLRSRLTDHAARQPWRGTAEAAHLVEAVVDDMRHRAVNG